MANFNALTVAGFGLGIAAGLGVFTFGYARGDSYLTDNPESCANCHVMREQLQSWMKSSHRSVAVCNDCHTPAGLIPKYFTKAKNGVFHSTAFTTGHFPDRIVITPGNYALAESACQKCHTEMTSMIGASRHDGAGGCIRCHSAVGHKE